MPEFDVKEQKPKTTYQDPEWLTKAQPYIDWLDARLGWRSWAILLVVLVSLFAGTPHMLITYQCYGNCSRPNAVEIDCDYLGIWGWTKAEPDEATRRCARFLLM